MSINNVEIKPKKLAVLPFELYSTDNDQEDFVLGLTEEIINSLANISGLLVTAKTSSFNFQNSKKTTQEIGELLGVEYIIEGSVRKSGNILRVTAQLIRVTDGFHLFSKTYDKEYKEKEIYSLQKDIADRVADTLKLSLKIGKAKSSKLFGGTDNFEAYKYYLMARIQLDKGKYQAKESINRAISLDPKNSYAWALKGLVHFMIAFSFCTADETPLEKTSALNAALHAIELEPNLGKAYLTLGTAYMMKGDFIEAERAYKKGINLTNEPIDYSDYGLTFYYIVVGRLKKCTEFLDEARKNDPFDKNLYATYILSLGFKRNIEGAEKEYQLGKDMFGDEWPYGDQVITLIRLSYGNTLSATEIVYSSKIFDSMKGYLDSPEKGLAELHKFYSEKNKLSEKDITDISVWAAYFGDPELAMDAIETGMKTNAMGFFKIWLPVMQDVRKLPRFKKLVLDTGLIDYWKEFGWPDFYCRPAGDDDFVCD